MPLPAPSIASVRGSDNPYCVRLYLTTSTGATSYLVQFSQTNLFDGSSPIEARGPFATPFLAASTFFSNRNNWLSPLSATQAAFDVANGYAFDPSNGGLILMKIPLARSFAAGGAPSWVSGLATGSTIYVRVGASNDGGATYTWSLVSSFTTATIVDAVAVTTTNGATFHLSDYLSALGSNAYKYYEYAFSQSGNSTSAIGGITPAPNTATPPVQTAWQHDQMFSFNIDTSKQDSLHALSYAITVDGTGQFSALASNSSGPAGGFTVLVSLS